MSRNSTTEGEVPLPPPFRGNVAFRQWYGASRLPPGQRQGAFAPRLYVALDPLAIEALIGRLRQLARSIRSERPGRPRAYPAWSFILSPLGWGLPGKRSGGQDQEIVFYGCSDRQVRDVRKQFKSMGKDGSAEEIWRSLVLLMERHRAIERRLDLDSRPRARTTKVRPAKAERRTKSSAPARDPRARTGKSRARGRKSRQG